MDSALSPRDIQSRIRAGASIQEVAEETGTDSARIECFALPVIAEREHVALTALSATVRRRGEGTGHRRLAEIIDDRLRSRGIDVDKVVWDAWRLPDRRWRVTGLLDDGSTTRQAEFTFDLKARFSIAHNADARWMIGEQPPGPRTPENENTIDFNDELALVRATQAEGVEITADDGDADDLPTLESLYPDSPLTSELDDLYDMMSGVSEDSVRIYIGLEESTQSEAELPEIPETPAAPVEPATAPVSAKETEPVEPAATAAPVAPPKGRKPATAKRAQPAAPATEPAQEPLVESEAAPKAKPKRRRAQIPSWDEIMFGGPGSK